MTTRNDRPQPGRGRGDHGAALLEFALLAVLLFSVVFGIIAFGMLLSFKQDMTRAAAEGARAGAVAFPADTALAEARAATEEAVEGFGKECGSGGMVCDVHMVTVDCDGAGPGTATCDAVEVNLRYDNDDDPITPPFPIISHLMPGTIQSTSVARTNS